LKKTVPNIVIYWLLLGCILVFAMVIIGGITRLTGSGLSITEWDLVKGTFPPTSQDAWQTLFEKYQTSPEYKYKNTDFSVEDFKGIFWWEYIHRLIGRFIGFVFVIPFLYFLYKKYIYKELLWKLGVIFFLGGLQGFLGWFMVKSGLIDNPAVSHYRLAAHLGNAFLSFGVTFWVALGLIRDKKPEIYNFKISAKSISKLKTLANLFFVFLCFQIIYGAFVAGLKAGFIHNYFPTMGDEWVASSVSFSFQKDGWISLLENKSTVQFIHRYLAYIVAGIALYLSYFLIKENQTKTLKTAGYYLSSMVILQFLLGVLTLIYVVPVSLGVIHQAGAFILLGITLYVLRIIKNKNIEIVA
jgi:heme a synthase